MVNITIRHSERWQTTLSSIQLSGNAAVCSTIRILRRQRHYFPDFSCCLSNCSGSLLVNCWFAAAPWTRINVPFSCQPWNLSGQMLAHKGPMESGFLRGRATRQAVNALADLQASNGPHSSRKHDQIARTQPLNSPFTHVYFRFVF